MAENSQQQGTFMVFRSNVFNNNNNSNSLNSSRKVTLPDPNKPLCFNGASKSYRDIVYGSKIRSTLNLSIETLTNDSETSRLALRNQRRVIKKIPRPQNSWIIFRRNGSSSPEFKKQKSSEVSAIIREKWKTASSEVKAYFNALSMLALENHNNKYGEYKYRPRQNPTKVQKSKKEKKQVARKDNNVQLTPDPLSPISSPAASTPVMSEEVSSDSENIESILEWPMDIQSFTNEQLSSDLENNEDEWSMDVNVNNLQSSTNEQLSSVMESPIIPNLFITLSSPEYLQAEDQYLPTPASSNQVSPVIFEDNLLSNFELLQNSNIIQYPRFQDQLTSSPTSWPLFSLTETYPSIATDQFVPPLSTITISNVQQQPLILEEERQINNTPFCLPPEQVTNQFPSPYYVEQYMNTQYNDNPIYNEPEFMHFSDAPLYPGDFSDFSDFNNVNGNSDPFNEN